MPSISGTLSDLQKFIKAVPAWKAWLPIWALRSVALEKIAAVAASPLAPGRGMPASAIASAIAVATRGSIGVSVAGYVTGDCSTTPTTFSR